MKKPISTEQTDENIKEVLRLLVETVTHLINCEAINAESIYMALLRDEPLIADIHPERDLGKLLRFDLLPCAELLAYFKLRRTVMLRVLETLSEKKWSRCIREEKKQRKESVYWRARGQAVHELEHLLDLESKLNKKTYK